MRLDEDDILKFLQADGHVVRAAKAAQSLPAPAGTP